jgi:hypothetical protein
MLWLRRMQVPARGPARVLRRSPDARTHYCLKSVAGALHLACAGRTYRFERVAPRPHRLHRVQRPELRRKTSSRRLLALIRGLPLRRQIPLTSSPKGGITSPFGEEGYRETPLPRGMGVMAWVTTRAEAGGFRCASPTLRSRATLQAPDVGARHAVPLPMAR